MEALIRAPGHSYQYSKVALQLLLHATFRTSVLYSLISCRLHPLPRQASLDNRSGTGNAGRIWAPAEFLGPNNDDNTWQYTEHSKTWSVRTFSFHIQMLLAEWCWQWFQLWTSCRYVAHAKLFMNLPWKIVEMSPECMLHPIAYMSDFAISFHRFFLRSKLLSSIWRTRARNSPNLSSSPSSWSGILQATQKCLWSSCCRYECTGRLPWQWISWCDLDIRGQNDWQVL